MKDFNEWIIKYKNKDSILGDFTKDYISNNYEFSYCYACNEAIKAFEELQKRYKSYLKKEAKS